jgi:hypothetical protein
MNISSIIVVVEPVPPDVAVSIVRDGHSLPAPKSVHKSVKYSQLVNEIRRRTSANVLLVEEFPQTVPPTGVILLYPRYFGFRFEDALAEYVPVLRGNLLRRTVLMNVIRGEAYGLLSQHHLAAIVEDFDCRYWWNLSERSHPRQAMHGLTTVAEEIGASVKYKLKKGYCYMLGKESENLPALLLRYLEAYVRIVPGVLG